MSTLGQAWVASLDAEDLLALAERLAALQRDRDDGWLDTKAAASYSGCSVHALRSAMARGQVEYQQPAGPGGKVYFEKAALEKWRRGR
jgi:hypothetical protein